MNSRPTAWRNSVLALVVGAALSLAFAPFGFWPIAILAPAVLFWLWDGVSPRRAASLGFAFGSGTFAAGTYWLYISINGFGKAPAWLALALMVALVALMALYPALLGYLANRFMPSRGAVRWLVGLPAGWTLLEWVRGWFLSGFGWLSLGYSQTDSWLAGWAPVGGIYTLSGWLALMAGALAMWRVEGTRALRMVLPVVVLPWIAGFLLMRIEWTQATGGPVDIAIVQGAIPQDQKWLAENRDESLRRYRDLTFSAFGTPLIVWPEAAAPDLANNLVPYINDLADAARQRNSSLLLGLIRAEPGELNDKGEPRVDYFNSILSLGDDFAWYDKHHLVPFGEFFPVPEAVRRWMRLMNLPYSDFSRGAAHQPPLQIAGLSLSASICYEDAYASSQIVSARESTALVNVTNDAWFGRSTARHQHLQISRMRAIEAQRFLIRAANDGISAVIGPRGEFVARAADFEAVVLRASITPRSGVPPYLRFGNQPILFLVIVGLLAALWMGRRRLVNR
ncbi:MAG: apolipoprotein N-acyltransferase [Gammaproteobacteria bacterium]